MPTLLDELRSQRAQTRAAAEEILTRAGGEQRDLSPDELREYTAHVTTQHEVDDRIEELRDAEVAELRAAQVRRPGPAAPREPVLTREQSVADWCQTRGMFTPDAAPLSFDRFLRGIATGGWDGAEHERALSEGTLTAGGHLVPSPLAARVIDLARNQTRTLRAGAVTVPMTGPTLKLARLTGEGSPAWKAENAAITAADMTFGSVTFSAHTLVRLITLSVELFEDADPSSEDVIARSFASQLALELDRVALLGTGTDPEPRGVLNTTGVTVLNHGTDGTAIGPMATGLGYDWLIDGIAAVRAANFEPTAQIVAPRTEQGLAKLKDTTGQYVQPPPGLVPRLPTKQIPINVTTGTSTDTSYAFTGQWDQLMIGIRTSFNLQFLRERFLADNLQYAFLAYLRADVQLAQPAAFAVDRGVRALMATDDHRLAEKAATWEREPGPRDQLPETPPEPQRAADDLLIERPDLGVGCYTLVAAGDPIPAELAELPRTPRATREQRRRPGKG